MMGETDNQLCGLASYLLVIRFNSLGKQAGSTSVCPGGGGEGGELSVK